MCIRDSCKEENKVAPGIQWNQIHRAENLQDRIINYFRVSCQHCDNPACLPVCPAKAIYKGPHGEVLVDQSKCIGCGACASACPQKCITPGTPYVINWAHCLQCGRCAEACPADAVRRLHP